MTRKAVDSPQQFRDTSAAQQQLLLPHAGNLVQVDYNEHQRLRRLGEAVQFFSTVDTGRLYWFVKDFGETIHLKFKWTEGPFKHHYEFWTCSFSTIADGLGGLMRKVLEVEAGKRQPTYDKPYER